MQRKPRALTPIDKTQVKYSSEGLAAIIFTSEGDMRQAINNLQATHSGFGLVSPEAVFKVCDLPHPVTINKMISACEKGDVDNAMNALSELWTQGYSAVDIVSTIFRVVKNNETMPEYRKLEFIKVGFGHLLVDLRTVDWWGTIAEMIIGAVRKSGSLICESWRVSVPSCNLVDYYRDCASFR